MSLQRLVAYVQQHIATAAVAGLVGGGNGNGYLAGDFCAGSYALG